MGQVSSQGELVLDTQESIDNLDVNALFNSEFLTNTIEPSCFNLIFF